MRFAAILITLILSVYTNRIFGCDEAQLLSCLKHKGGVTCFYKHSCQQDKYQSAYCHNFDLSICLKNEGGKACLFNLDECRFLFEEEKKQKSALEDSSQTNTNANSIDKNDKYCATQKVKVCLKHKGGEACYKKYGCDPATYKMKICQNFNLKSCLRSKGGNACYKTHNDCKVVVKKEETKAPENSMPESRSIDSRTVEQPSTNNTTSAKNNSIRIEPAESQKTPQDKNDSTLSCDSEKVNQCEKKGGGANCYQKFNCSALTYQIHFCQNFDEKKCTQFQGGKTCSQIYKNCQLFLSKVVIEHKTDESDTSNPVTPNESTNLKPETPTNVVIDQTLQPPSNGVDKKDQKGNVDSNLIPIISPAVTKEFCVKFNFQNCIKYNGGEACQKNKDACKTFIADSKDAVECQKGTIENPKINELNQVALKLNSSAKDKMTEEAMLAKLRSYGHKVFPINELSVIVKKGSSVNYSDLKSNNCSALLSGTFFGGNYNPVGPFISSNQVTIPDSKTVNRGYVAVMSDGSVSVSSMNDTNYNFYSATDRADARSLFNEHIRKVESDKSAKMVQMLGGGALLVRNGKAVSAGELESHQFFDQGIGNLTAAQMRQTNHVVAFVHNGRPYAMMTSSVSGRTLQKDLLEVKAENAVKFDGGSGCVTYVAGRSQNICPSHGANPTGLCVK